MLKKVILFTSLLLPILIFIFLKYFGKNEFDLPVYYVDNIEEMPSGCLTDYSIPYTIPNSSAIECVGNTIIFFCDGMDESELKVLSDQLKRIDEEFEDSDFAVIKVKTELREEGDLQMEPEMLIIEKRCNFLMGLNRIVLVDEERRIRGYYEDTSLKEIDRLILELKILTKDY